MTIVCVIFILMKRCIPQIKMAFLDVIRSRIFMTTLNALEEV